MDNYSVSVSYTHLDRPVGNDVDCAAAFRDDRMELQARRGREAVFQKSKCVLCQYRAVEGVSAQMGRCPRVGRCAKKDGFFRQKACQCGIDVEQILLSLIHI